MFSAEGVRVVPPLSPHIIADPLPLNYTFSYACHSLQFECLRFSFSLRLNLIVPYRISAYNSGTHLHVTSLETEASVSNLREDMPFSL
jgi:hypothetical protein